MFNILVCCELSIKCYRCFLDIPLCIEYCSFRIKIVREVFLVLKLVKENLIKETCCSFTQSISKLCKIHL